MIFARIICIDQVYCTEIEKLVCTDRTEADNWLCGLPETLYKPHARFSRGLVTLDGVSTGSTSGRALCGVRALRDQMLTG